MTMVSPFLPMATFGELVFVPAGEMYDGVPNVPPAGRNAAWTRVFRLSERSQTATELPAASVSTWMSVAFCPDSDMVWAAPRPDQVRSACAAAGARSASAALSAATEAVRRITGPHWHRRAPLASGSPPELFSRR